MFVDAIFFLAPFIIMEPNFPAAKYATIQFQPALKGLKNILLDKWHLIQNQPNLRELVIQGISLDLP